MKFYKKEKRVLDFSTFGSTRTANSYRDRFESEGVVKRGITVTPFPFPLPLPPKAGLEVHAFNCLLSLLI